MTTRLVIASILASFWSCMVSLCVYAAIGLAADGDPALRLPAACFAVLIIPSTVLLDRCVRLTATTPRG